MEAIAIESSIWIEAPIERAWQAVTEPARLTSWYAPLHAWEIPVLAVGERVKFDNSDTEALYATIEVVDYLHQFTLRWDASDDDQVVLTTSFLLTSENGGTRVTLRESGYESVPENERQQWLDAVGSGYIQSMENLKAYLEGQSLPHQ